MLGYDFDRQRPIDRYIVDFYCKDLCLAIEIDGASHNFTFEEDQIRQQRLESLGVRFLRFWNVDVEDDMQTVLGNIRDWIEEHRDEASPRSVLSPSSEGCPKGGVGRLDIQPLPSKHDHRPESSVPLTANPGPE